MIIQTHFQGDLLALGLPDSFRPAKHVYDQSTIRPRPWRLMKRSSRDVPAMAVDASYCSNNSVPPEQTDAYDSTEVVR